MSFRDSPALEISEVSHSYGRRRRLSDVTTRFDTGVTGLLGPNGAGKSTLMKLITTALPLQEGTITHGELVWGPQRAQEIRKLVGYLPQRFEVMGWSSVRDNITYAGWAQGIDAHELPQAAERVLDLVDLREQASQRARTLSGGMRQRLGLACAMIHQPQILVLDEPTVGLDPVQRQQLRVAIRAAGSSAIVIMSTHLVEDLATVADKVVILREGSIVFDADLDRLRQLGAGHEAEHASVLEAGYHVAQSGTS